MYFCSCKISVLLKYDAKVFELWSRRLVQVGKQRGWYGKQPDASYRDTQCNLSWTFLRRGLYLCTHNIPCRRGMVVVIVVVYLSTEMFVYVYQAPSKKQKLLCEKPRQLYREAICRSETRSCLSTVGLRLLILSAKVLKRLQSSPEAGRPPSLWVVVKIVLPVLPSPTQLPLHLVFQGWQGIRLYIAQV